MRVSINMRCACRFGVLVISVVITALPLLASVTKWGPYGLVTSSITEKRGGFAHRVPIFNIINARGRIAKQVRDEYSGSFTWRLVDLNGFGIPELEVRSETAGTCHIASYHYLAQDGGLRHVLSFGASGVRLGDFNHHRIIEIALLDAEPAIEVGGLSHAECPAVLRVIAPRAARSCVGYADVTTRFPALVHKQADSYQYGILQDPDGKHHMGAKRAMVGYVVNTTTIGKGDAARKWTVKHCDPSLKTWFQGNVSAISKPVNNRVRLSQANARIIPFTAWH